MEFCQGVYQAQGVNSEESPVQGRIQVKLGQISVNSSFISIPSHMIFRYINTSSIFHAGHFKGPFTTPWIWNLHSDAHDFHIQQSLSSMKIRRKVFSSNLAHLSLVFFWMTGMHFHGAYFSNYDIWSRDPKHSLPSAQCQVLYQVHNSYGKSLVNIFSIQI